MNNDVETVGLVEIKDTEGLISYEPQRLPDSVFYVDKGGILVSKEEILDNGRITKVIGKLPSSPYETKHWTKEEVEALPDFIYYISNVDGGYIGTEEEYKLLVEKYKLILIQKASPTDNVCSIGYNPEENKWYGWSHRAICGFTVGDTVGEHDITATSGLTDEYRIQHPDEDMSLPVGYKAKDLNGAKRMAIAFADAVS